MNKQKTPWSWIPSLYFAEGLPYVVIMTVSVIMYKRMGISNGDIALYTSWLYLPWVIKPLWSPIIDLFKTKRIWIVVMQLLIGAGMGGVALTIQMPNFFQYTLLFFWLMAFSSATHDIAADGFYMLALDESKQAFFVGIRSTFYRVAMIAGQGMLIILAGYWEVTKSITFAWTFTFVVIAVMFVIFALFHWLMLPKPDSDHSVTEIRETKAVKEFFASFSKFFIKKKIGWILGFLLFFRFAEAQLVKMAAPFMLDARNLGGLGLTTSEVGFIYGTVGIISLVLGGLLGGFSASAKGLKYWIWWMIIAINIPNSVYVYLSLVQPESFWIINACVAVEQFGYGFGFTAYVLYMIHISEGEFKTSHYAIATGFMALGMMIPGMFSGMIEEMLGYKTFFIYIMFATIPSFLVAKFIPIDPNFGKKKKTSTV
ncbi:MAG: MFS transporter [Melioribacteraceae bacterium]